MESYKSPFARLLEDSNALEYWNTFIEKSEEEQLKIIRAFSDKFCDNNLQSVHKSNKHGRLSSRIRHTIKIKKNLSLEVVKGLEEDLIKFFKTTPQNKYIRSPQTSFDRLLVHAAAQYHKLKSISVLDEEKGKRSVEVYNTHTDWTPADYFLADFIKELRR
uniref:R3H domain-containing protein 4 n=2 Tax=Anoplophora glabripennis TaxID=217634 RepID=V5I960_ANOGL